MLRGIVAVATCQQLQRQLVQERESERAREREREREKERERDCPRRDLSAVAA
jgi:hypothetical protein